MGNNFRFQRKPIYDATRLDRVRVRGEIGGRIDRTIEKNLLALDLKHDFLEPFQKRTGAAYIGLGKNLEGIVHFAFTKKTAALLQLKTEVIDALLSSRDQDGHIGTKSGEQRMVTLWDCHEAVHIVSGLLADWFCFDQRGSLDAARRLLDMVIEHWDSIVGIRKQYRWPFSIHMPSLGLEYALLGMYKATGQAKYLDFCCETCGLENLDWPIQLERFAPLYGHSYMYLHHCRCQLELYGLRPRASLLRMSRRALQFMLTGNGMTISGGVGQSECWTDDQDGRGNHAETCSTVYQLRFFSDIFRLTGNPRCGDLIERTLYNSLWAAQSPEGRDIRYYAPLEGERVYHRDTYCCPNNFRRFMAELPGMIFFAGRKCVAVNLYTDSDADVELGGKRLRLTQKTSYPEDGRVAISVEPATPFEFTLQLRIPLWCSKPVVRLNGQCQQGVIPGCHFDLKRVWSSGDHVELDLPLEIRFVQGRQRQYGLVAVMRGPLLYGLAPGNIHRIEKPNTGQKAAALSPESETARFAGWDGAAFCKIRLKPSSAQLLPDQSIHILADLDSDRIGVSGEYELHLTRFPDPEVRCVYFHCGEPDRAVPDELLSGNGHLPAGEIVHGPLHEDF